MALLVLLALWLVHLPSSCHAIRFPFYYYDQPTSPVPRQPLASFSFQRPSHAKQHAAEENDDEEEDQIAVSQPSSFLRARFWNRRTPVPERTRHCQSWFRKRTQSWVSFWFPERQPNDRWISTSRSNSHSVSRDDTPPTTSSSLWARLFRGGASGPSLEESHNQNSNNVNMEDPLMGKAPIHMMMNHHPEDGVPNESIDPNTQQPQGQSESQPSSASKIPLSSDYQKSLVKTKKTPHQQPLLTRQRRRPGHEEPDHHHHDDSNSHSKKKYYVTVWQEQGARPYMEDEYLVGSDVVAIFDGHGGKAVSRYLKQNLWAELQRSTALTQQHKQASPHNDRPDDETRSSSRDDKNDGDLPGHSSTLSVDDYVQTLAMALEKVDHDVQKISHWSFQGSTAVVAWLHEEKVLPPPELPDNDEIISVENNVEPVTIFDQNNEESDTTSSLNDGTTDDPLIPHPIPPTYTTNTTLIVANIGDSRAILSREGRPVVLTRDHKPDDPEEYQRITSLGGRVTVRGTVPRVNGNLALSRALGDRSERPYVTAEPEFTTIPIHQGRDDFILFATDGLWDVMSNWEVVDFVLTRLPQRAPEPEQEPGDAANPTPMDYKEQITQLLVQEALDRGSYDNITVVIIWLKDT